MTFDSQVCPEDYLKVVPGPNFSGRTDFLRQVSGLAPSTAQDEGEARAGVQLKLPEGLAGLRFTYVPAEVHTALSGLTQTVASELAIHGIEPGGRGAAHYLVESLGLGALAGRNPFELSGGEQALLVVLAAFGLEGCGLALDCCLEQVDAGIRTRLLEGLGASADRKRILLADNRLSEYQQNLPVLTGVGWRPSGPSTLKPVRHVLPEVGLAVESGDLVLEDLTFAYGKGPMVLRGVSTRLEAGTVNFLEGANGSGKSTLAKLISGVLRPRSGRIRFGCKTVKPWQNPGRLSGYHFQNPDLQLFASSVSDEIGTSMLHLGLSDAARARGIAGWTEALGLGDVHGAHPLDLPFTGRKRVALAATLAMGSPWIILDEPTLGQDDGTMEALASITKACAAQGRGVIVVAHSSRFKRLVEGNTLTLEGGRLD